MNQQNSLCQSQQKNANNSQQQSTQLAHSAPLCQKKQFADQQKLQVAAPVLAERPAPGADRMPAEAHLEDISLPIQKNGQLEPVPISKQVSGLMRSRHLKSNSAVGPTTITQQNQIHNDGQNGKQSELLNQDILTEMFNQNFEQLENAPNQIDRAATIAKTRIYSVMKHTPPRPPQQQVHKLPPMGAIAQTKQQFNQATIEDQYLLAMSAQNKRNQNQSFLNQNLGKSANSNNNQQSQQQKTSYHRTNQST